MIDGHAAISIVPPGALQKKETKILHLNEREEEISSPPTLGIMTDAAPDAASSVASARKMLLFRHELTKEKRKAICIALRSALQRQGNDLVNL